jgi:hypothetical protein
MYLLYLRPCQNIKKKVNQRQNYVPWLEDSVGHNYTVHTLYTIKSKKVQEALFLVTQAFRDGYSLIHRNERREKNVTQVMSEVLYLIIRMLVGLLLGVHLCTDGGYLGG